MISDFLKNAFISVNRNKKNKTLIIIFSLLLFLLFIDVIIIKNFFDYYDYAIDKNIGFRTFQVYHSTKNYKEVVEELEGINHVLEVVNASYTHTAVYSDITDNGFDGLIGLTLGTENITPSSVVGKNIKDMVDGELICPYSFYPDSADYFDIDETKFLSEKEILNREITLTYNKKSTEIVDNEVVEKEEKATKKMKIVGLYDESTFQNGVNVCYAKLDDIKEIQDAYNPFLDDTSFANVIVVVDERSNLNEVRRSIQDLGSGYLVDSSTTSSLDKTFTTILFSVTTVVAIVLIVTIIFIFKNYIIKKIKNESKYIGILRSCGYTKLQVLKQEIIENIVIFGISFIISTIVFSGIFLILNWKIFKYLKYGGFNFTNNVLVLLLVFLIVLGVSIYVNYKVINKEIDGAIIDVLKES